MNEFVDSIFNFKRSLQFSPSALETTPEAMGDKDTPEPMFSEIDEALLKSLFSPKTTEPANKETNTYSPTEIDESEMVEAQASPAEMVEPPVSPAEMVEPLVSPAEMVEPEVFFPIHRSRQPRLSSRSQRT